MMKRSLLVLTLLAAGIALGVLATGVLKVRDSIPAVEAARPDDTAKTAAPETTPVAAPTPEPPADPPRQDPPAANGGPKIGVVNLRMCFDENNYEWAKEVTAELKKLDDEHTRVRKALEKEMIDTKSQMDAFGRQNPLWQEKARKFKLLEMQYKLDNEIARAKFIAEYSQKKMEVYNEIRRVIDIYGKDRKFDLIFRVEEPQLDDDSPQYVSQQVAARVVLYHGEAYDVTKDVLKLLNAEWAKKKAATKPPDPPPQGMCPTCNIPRAVGDKCPKCGKEVPKK